DVALQRDSLGSLGADYLQSYATNAALNAEAALRMVVDTGASALPLVGPDNTNEEKPLAAQ
ncbi:MAG: hypothetical protein AAFO77_15480, partial [Pseudomonadota bacterium]